ncbi:Der1-like family-domain-containing protein [Clohesyomyces aquaticus]|uniref:Derlin n=1 Tax=Clohesyomyces aquaticus TaxID=1231657 RepID=A0A1Y2A151_9PLEO|nr:Der1-like family-domain-containing protein [Clohesyomyces aquaticus]
MDVFWTLPPVSRTITALAVTVSALGYSGMINFSNYVFFMDYIFTIKMVPQLWRLFTSFLITKPKFGIILDPYFLYQYGAGLETESPRFPQPGDFFVYTMFVGTVILGAAGVVLRSYTFLQALSLAFAYTYAQDNPTRQVSFFIITFDAKYLPFSMLFLTFIIDGPESAMTQLTGLIAAHLFDFLTRIWPTFGGGRNYIFTPAVVKQWFGGRPGNVTARPYGSVQQGRAPEDPASARATGRSTGFGGGWDGRGPGYRLGEQ